MDIEEKYNQKEILIAGIAWLIIPQKWTINIGSGPMEINSWRVFLAICSLPEFLACVALFAFPESPRFLLLKGRREEALEVFKKIYSVNTGKEADTYPVSDTKIRFFPRKKNEKKKNERKVTWDDVRFDCSCYLINRKTYF